MLAYLEVVLMTGHLKVIFFLGLLLPLYLRGRMKGALSLVLRVVPSFACVICFETAYSGAFCCFA